MSNDFDGIIGGEAYDQKVKEIPGFMEMQQVVGDLVEKMGKELRSQDPCKTIQIFEIGVGTGITTMHILDSLQGSVYIEGVEIEPKMIDTFKTKTSYCSRYSIIKESPFSFIENKVSPCRSRIVTVHRDSANYFLYHNLQRNIDNKTLYVVDAVVSAATIHNICSKVRDKLFYDIKHKLRPEGIFIMADKIAVDDYAQHINDLAAELKLLDDLPEDLRQSWLEHYAFDEQPGIKLTESDLEKTLANTGFTDIKKVWRQGLNAVYTATKPK